MPEDSYPKPALTADVVVLTRSPNVNVLLIRRKHDPFAGAWALPGGFVEANEPPIQAAARELREETGVIATNLQLLDVFGEAGRDPRGWTVSVVYTMYVENESVKAQAGDDAADVAWHSLDQLPKLAFDHERILEIVRLGRPF